MYFFVFHCLLKKILHFWSIYEPTDLQVLALQNNHTTLHNVFIWLFLIPDFKSAKVGNSFLMYAWLVCTSPTTEYHVYFIHLW